ncbi:transcriptional regulator GcvA [Aestuariirhabdus litorea]|uniref:Transcriptional regulator GcvA n=1 Tax=Aestuariirhabdus litorea TaxID=2528527 RepID=A0A3P3VNG0_9GAMM|nr:transcriptional regulator GcvA [Aestuariirhabdus litorea]RRJ84291.1 transcriptional regulator GcvA [Aestuariirhabdus litorea]RWW97514.1 transcriptional regulator GcvA [Endozoicomonadaceae bacterium GTF-13]
MKLRLPSLNGFRVFEAAARHLSFTRAADELFVSQAAVSQQIRQLEEQLGYPLFRRLSRRLLLTDEGQRLLPFVSEAMHALQQGVQTLIDEQQQRPLNLSVLPSLAYRWLIPRLIRYSTQHPDQEVRISASLSLVDFGNSDMDMAIRFGRGHYPGLHSELLMRDEAYPVCSPRLLEEGPPLTAPADLLHYRLLHDMGPGDLDWVNWFHCAGVNYQPRNPGYTIGDSSLTIEAALSGQGVALARATLVEEEVASGRLVRPFTLSLPSEFAYYLVMPREKRDLKRVQLFCQWLHSAANQPSVPARPQ